MALCSLSGGLVEYAYQFHAVCVVMLYSIRKCLRYLVINLVRDGQQLVVVLVDLLEHMQDFGLIIAAAAPTERDAQIRRVGDANPRTADLVVELELLVFALVGLEQGGVGGEGCV